MALRRVAVASTDPGGYDQWYTSLSSAEASEQGDLVTLDRQLEIDCYPLTTPESGDIIIAGWTTDATRTIKLRAAPTQRHDGRWSTSAYRLVNTSTGSDHVLECRVPYVTIDGLQVEVAGNRSGDKFGIGVYWAIDDVTVQNCIVRYTGTAPAGSRRGLNYSGGTAIRVKFVNNLVYGFKRGADTGTHYGIYLYGKDVGTNLIYSNTVADCHIGIEASRDRTAKVTNNISIGCTTCFVMHASMVSGTGYNVSSDATANRGTNNKTGVTPTFVGAAGGDYRLASTDTVALDAGADLSADSYYPFSTDAIGATRAAPWSIGAFEVGVVVGGGAVTLAVQDASHAHASENPALSQAGTLAVQEAAHTQAADSPALTQGYVLSAQEALHSHGADSPLLTQANLLAVSDALHAHAAEAPVLTFGALLTLQDAIHAHGADSPALTQALILAIQDAMHGHTADGLTLTQAHVLAVLDALHAHTADTVYLGERVMLDLVELEVSLARRLEVTSSLARRLELTAEV